MRFIFVSCKNCSPQQLHAHRLDQFTFSLPAENQCCVFSVVFGIGHPPLRLHTYTADPERGTSGLINTNGVIITVGNSPGVGLDS